MTFADAVRSGVRNVVCFGGRASRSEFWWFVLFVSLGWFGAALVDEAVYKTSTSFRSPVTGAFKIVAVVPTLSVAFRRLQDGGLPGWLILVPAAVLLGILYLAFDLGRTLWIARGAAVETSSFASAYLSVVLWLAMPLALTTLIVMSWALLMPSEPEPNRYGRPPA